MRLRSPREYWFRGTQLLANGAMWAFPGARQGREFHFLERYREIILTVLPAIDARELRDLADAILLHRFPIFAGTLDTGAELDWRRDYVSGRSSELQYFRFVPYLDFDRVGDHKMVWELNRHQHWMVLARAFLVFRDQRYLQEIRAEMSSWRAQNPFLQGINWASTLEVALRSLSWMAVVALVGDQFTTQERGQWWADLHQHGRYIANNLSVYFAPNTHLLGEALALAALGRFLGIPRWSDLGDATLFQQRSVQVLPDGGYFEQSTFYHVYALDMFLLHSLLRGDEEPDSLVIDMAHWLSCISGPSRKLAFLGDDDGGNLFWPYGPREDFGLIALERAELVCQRKFECPPSSLFSSTGLATFSSGDVFILIDCGPFGAGGAGHSHSDALSFVVRCGDQEILIDPGTYTYTADLQARDRFRGAESHSTVRVDKSDQARPVNPFRWEDKPTVDVLEWRPNELLIAECRTTHFRHRREFRFDGNLTIIDTVEGAAGKHDVEQFWQSAPQPVLQADGSLVMGSAVLTLSAAATMDIVPSERSTCYGEKTRSYRVCARMSCALPVHLESMLTFRKS